MKRTGIKGDGTAGSPPSSPPLSARAEPRKQRELKAHHVFHTDLRASLLSTEAPAQNYRGLINLVMLVMVFFTQHVVRAIYMYILIYCLIVCHTYTIDHGEYAKVWNFI